MVYEVRMSVKQLVEFVLRCGSIDNRFSGFDRALEGARIHRRIQKAGGDNYSAEVSLSLQREYMGITYIIDGRADGIINDETGITIDEIKTTAVPLYLIEDDFNTLHWAQAMCYGLFYCIKNNIDKITIQLTYFNIESEAIKRFTHEMTVDELNEFYDSLLLKYKTWADFEVYWRDTRNTSIKELKFPFENYRKGQRPLAAAVYKSIDGGQKLYCQAPTGTGKTISTLFPSIKAIGENKAEKIFYLTAKTITRTAAENSLLLMRKKGLKLKSVTLTAKDKICFLDERNCNPNYCKYANGHYDRVNNSIEYAIKNFDNMDKSTIEECAEKYMVCPFELSLDLSLWCDCVICDYNYLFDPQVYLRRFFTDNNNEFVFLIDEAHNLVDRSHEMFSAGLLKSKFLELKKAVGKNDTKLYNNISKINSELIKLKKLCTEDNYFISKENIEDFNKILYKFTSCCEEWLEINQSSENQPMLLQLYFDTLSYLKISEVYDSRYTTYVTTSGSEVYIKLFCLDPSFLLSEAMKRGKSTILFSATLTPLNYFLSVLGGDDNSKKLLLPSPFDTENMGLIIADYISTKYKNRENSIEPIADILFKTISGKKGNYMVYFPSYKYMNEVYEVFTNKYTDIETLLQLNKMQEAEREKFLLMFDSDNKETLLGFCVLGGLYSEGIDLKGERLIGTIIIGVGLPQLSVEQNIIKDYYDSIDYSGYEYAYTYPGMNKVLQASGRVIRSENDKGIIVLVDDRFLSTTYKNLYPQHWLKYKTVHNETMLFKEIQSFWQKIVNSTQ